MRAPLVVTLAVIGSAGALASAGGCGLDTVGSDPEIVEAGPDGRSGSSGLPGSSGTSGSSGSSGSTDADADAESDGGAEGEAGADDGGDAGCPAECSSCTGGRCQIDCPGTECGTTITCPAGMPCLIQCGAANACASKTINCADGQPCRLRCEGGACASVAINAATASALCITCNGNASNRGCTSLMCNSMPAACGLSCAAGGTACASVACAGCDTSPACP
ncbi:MAG: hypothetical protein KF764_22395 [Labilithrix sp.]|nr:hypothetical protein [Labilithrix sp.]